MNLTDVIRRRPLLAYFVLVFVLTWGASGSSSRPSQGQATGPHRR